MQADIVDSCKGCHLIYDKGKKVVVYIKQRMYSFQG